MNFTKCNIQQDCGPYIINDSISRCAGQCIQRLWKRTIATRRGVEHSNRIEELLYLSSSTGLNQGITKILPVLYEKHPDSRGTICSILYNVDPPEAAVNAMRGILEGRQLDEKHLIAGVRGRAA